MKSVPQDSKTFIRYNMPKLTMTAPTRAVHIAPCGMNCGVCRAHQREHEPCPGCRIDDVPKPKTRAHCYIKTCDKLAEQEITFCFDCGDFPCARLMKLDERYRANYGMSMIENLLNIKRYGIRHFVRNENRKWKCQQCGETLCVHHAACPSCGTAWRKYKPLMKRT